MKHVLFSTLCLVGLLASADAPRPTYSQLERLIQSVNVVNEKAGSAVADFSTNNLTLVGSITSTVNGMNLSPSGSGSGTGTSSDALLRNRTNTLTRAFSLVEHDSGFDIPILYNTYGSVALANAGWRFNGTASRATQLKDGGLLIAANDDVGGQVDFSYSNNGLIPAPVTSLKVDGSPVVTSNMLTSVLSGYTPSSGTADAVAWSGITGKPTTLSGYGLSGDAYTKTEVNQLISEASIAGGGAGLSRTAVVAEVVSAANTNAGAVAAAQALVDGLASEVDGAIAAAVNGLAAVASSGSYADLTNTPTIPTALPSPASLTFTGAASGSYDGASAKTVNIPDAYTKTEVDELIDGLDAPDYSTGNSTLVSTITGTVNGMNLSPSFPYTTTTGANSVVITNYTINVAWASHSATSARAYLADDAELVSVFDDEADTWKFITGDGLWVSYTNVTSGVAETNHLATTEYVDGVVDYSSANTTLRQTINGVIDEIPELGGAGNYTTNNLTLVETITNTVNLMGVAMSAPTHVPGMTVLSVVGDANVPAVCTNQLRFVSAPDSNVKFNVTADANGNVTVSVGVYYK